MEQIFFGAGMSISSGLPNASDLAKIVKSEADFEIEDILALDIYGIADWCDDKGKVNLKNRLKQIIASSLTTAVHTISPEYKMMAYLIKKDKIKAIYTTNQDALLETILDKQGISYNRYTYLSKGYSKNINGNLDIIKMHGDIHNPHDMCFSKTEIDNATKQPIVTELIESVKSIQQFVFIGYSFYTEDALSDKLLDSLKTGNNIIVDPWINERHKNAESFGNICLEMSAEEYFEREIRNLKEKIHVRHILFSSKNIGGVQTYYESLNKICREAEVPIRFTATDTEGYYFDPEKDTTLFNKHSFGVNHLRATAMSRTYQSIADNNRTKNKEDHIDIIHAHDFITAYHATEIGFPAIYTSHSLQSKEDEIEKNNKLREFDGDFIYNDAKFLEDLYYRNLDHILVLCDSYRKTLPKGVRHSAKIITAPFIPPPDRRKAAAPAKDKPVTIAYVGRASYRKGIDIFIESMSLLYEEFTDFNVRLIGPKMITRDNKISIDMEGSYASGSQEKTYAYEHNTIKGLEIKHKQLTLDSSAGDSPGKFDEHLKELWKLYDDIDILVVPSRYEPYGYVVLEALAMGKIVVAARVGGLIELLDDQKCGVLVDVGEDEKAPEYFKDAIKWVIYSRKEAADRAAAGQEWVYRRYTDEMYKKIAEEIYDNYLTAMFRVDKYKAYDERCKTCECFESGKPCDHYGLCERMKREFCERTHDCKAYNTESECEHWTWCGQYKQRRFKEILQHKSGWKDILETAAKEYIKFSENDEGGEDHNMAWEAARWIKQNKAACPEVRMITHKNLAMLITQVARILPKHSETK